LRLLCARGLCRRSLDASAVAHDRLKQELVLIEAGGLASYFLVVRDIARYARRRGHGMALTGSAGNCLVCYMLEITTVNPLAVARLFAAAALSIGAGALAADRRGCPAPAGPAASSLHPSRRRGHHAWTDRGICAFAARRQGHRHHPVREGCRRADRTRENGSA